MVGDGRGVVRVVGVVFGRKGVLSDHRDLSGVLCGGPDALCGRRGILCGISFGGRGMLFGSVLCGEQ